MSTIRQQWAQKRNLAGGRIKGWMCLIRNLAHNREFMTLDERIELLLAVGHLRTVL